MTDLDIRFFFSGSEKSDTAFAHPICGSNLSSLSLIPDNCLVTSFRGL